MTPFSTKQNECHGVRTWRGILSGLEPLTSTLVFFCRAKEQRQGTEGGANMLYLVTTPIGNLEDMTARAIRVLSEVDLIAAEDTRNSKKLLSHFAIHTPMTSYHNNNRFDKGRELTEMLVAGKNIAVITDAGMPGISDPGEELVKMALEAGVEVTAVPGACACVTALTISGLPTRRFCFEAFLPTEKKERARVMVELVSLVGSFSQAEKRNNPDRRMAVKILFIYCRN